jgi:ADP-ribose pyrophosphatase YjhB (NUDIX family)
VSLIHDGEKMMPLPDIQPVRVSAKALIVANGQLLCVHKRDEIEDYFTLPGGGQEPGEALPDALRRECLEEIGVDVRVGRLRFVRDYIGRNHAFAAMDGHRHALDVIFACTLAPGAVPRLGSMPDSDQVGVAWLEIARLREFQFYPATLGDALNSDADSPIYLGDVN